MNMNASIIWKPPSSAMSNNFSGLLDNLVIKHGIPDLDQIGFQAFMEEPGDGVVLLTEEPDTAAESWDMAVIFPELLAAIGTNLRAAVLRPENARALQTRFGLGRLPALLFLRDGAYVGAIEGLRDWAEFVTECAAMLQKPVSRTPSIGIAVSVASPSSCH
jgi:hydrogenase-1 operon protein HyaE